MDSVWVRPIVRVPGTMKTSEVMVVRAIKVAISYPGLDPYNSVDVQSVVYRTLCEV